ncbi:MAG: hypothetical protein KTR32_42615 [Granulosicoccus sp.]|nr:hypothetical protein [Granulosicoccus sp.]
MSRSIWRPLATFLLFLLAVITVYIGGFVYDEVGPMIYALSLAILASTPLLLQLAFWKKLLMMLPLLIFRVIGKILFKVFGKNALSRLMQRYDTLEQRLSLLTDRAGEYRQQAMARWATLSRDKRGYLVLIFLPLAIVIFFFMLIVRIVRLKFLQMIVEKIMQAGVEKATNRLQKKSDTAEKTAKPD